MNFFAFIPARCNASAVLVLGVCLSVCLSVTSWYCIETTIQIELILTHRLYSTDPIHGQIRGNWGISKNKSTSLSNFVRNIVPVLGKKYTTSRSVVNNRPTIVARLSHSASSSGVPRDGRDAVRRVVLSASADICYDTDFVLLIFYLLSFGRAYGGARS